MLIVSFLMFNVMDYSEALKVLQTLHEEATKCKDNVPEGWYLLQHISANESLMEYLLDNMYKK